VGVPFLAALERPDRVASPFRTSRNSNLPYRKKLDGGRGHRIAAALPRGRTARGSFAVHARAAGHFFSESEIVTKRVRRKKVDPRRILEDIAADPKVPAVLRVRAARMLLNAEEKPARRTSSGLQDDDPITRRALEIAAERNRRLN